MKNMKNIKKKLGDFLTQVLGMKLRYRMMFLYVVGGALPMILIGLYLVNGTNRLLVEQAKSAEITEVEMERMQIEELLSTVSMVSKYYIFDEDLERIASKDYTNYQEMVTDFRNYTTFTQYESYYNRIISWTSVYMENESLRGNAHFVKVNDKIREMPWYSKVMEKKGGVIWQYIPVSTGEYEGLALTRLIRTKKSENVGILVMHIYRNRLTDIINTKDCDTMIILNGDTMVAAQEGNSVTLDQIREFLPEGDWETHQDTVTVDKEEYVMTCSNIQFSDSEDTIQIVSLRSHRDILGNADQQNRQSMFFYFFSAAISIIVILIFSWSFSERVGRFHKQMQKAASGEFDLVENIGGNDEISELYDYLGTMIWEIRRLLAEVYRERIRAEQLKSEQKSAEFKMLASQINPHFLYNTLETIRMKARTNGQYDIERLVKMLAKILRKNIRAGSQEVALKAEVELIVCYLEIQKYRFGDRIQYEIHLAPELEEFQVFPLLLQPIVENSIIHGLEIKEGIGHIMITASKVEDKVKIVIEDDGVGMDEETLKRLRKDMESREQDNTHIGVGNVHRRIRLRYGEEYGVCVESARGVGTRVEILLPWQSEKICLEEKEESGGVPEYVQGNGN